MAKRNTATVETASDETVKLNRNERRKQQRAAKKNNVTPITELAGTVDGNGEGLEISHKLEGTVDAQDQVVRSTDTVVVEETKVAEESTSDRGRTTKIIMEMMLQPEGTTREAIIKRLQEEFPNKQVSALKNTVGALMHVIPVRMNWKVEKTQIDIKDKRKMNFRVVGLKAEVAEPEAAAA